MVENYAVGTTIKPSDRWDCSAVGTSVNQGTTVRGTTQARLMQLI